MNSALGFWDMYKKSEDGKRVLDTFDVAPVFASAEDDKISFEAIYQWAVGVYDFACEKEPELFPKSYKTDFPDIYAKSVLATLTGNLKNDAGLFDVEKPSRELFEKFIDSFYLSYEDEEGKEIVYTEAGNYRDKSSDMHVLSMVLYFNNPFFIPMLYYARFDIIQSSCARLGIEMPVLPKLSKYRDYLLYYYDLCVTIDKWREEQGMDDVEICACLYDYAPRYIASTQEVQELPKPTNVWFVGADKDDFETIDNFDDPTPHLWQCNDRVLRGDIVVLYCRTPRSFIHSIWRANCDGLFNPFDNYTTRTFLVNGIRVPEITIKELHAHSYFKEVPIVKKNLRGIGRTELSATDYEELLKWIGQKGGDVEKLPKLYEGTWKEWDDIAKEHNVELHLEKFLEDIGYEKGDWKTQLKYKKGRGESEIPDYVILPEGEELHKHSPLMIEVKKHMKTSKERAENFSQAYSYARSVFARYLGICDKVRLIIYERNSEGCYDQKSPIFDEQWATIYNDPSTFARVKKLIGKSVLQHQK